jgi:hypothetical protein
MRARDYRIAHIQRVTICMKIGKMDGSEAMTPIEIGARAIYRNVYNGPNHGNEDEYWDNHEDAMKAALTALSEAGWSLVPSEVSEAMRDAGESVDFLDYAVPDEVGIYKAMIKAGAYKV